MTAPLDEKGLEATIARLGELAGMRSVPSVLTRAGREFIAKNAIRAYLSTAPAPDGLDGLLDRVIARLQKLDDYAGRPAWEQVLREELGASFSRALKERDIAERNRDAARDNFHTMQQAADQLRQRAETAEAEVKRLTEENEALREAIAEIADFDPDGPIDPDTVHLVRIAGAARRATLNSREKVDG